MSAKDDNEFDADDTAIIREIYDSENAYDHFTEELERALDAGYKVIIIEPHRLGDETARWISVGNCLHKTAIFSGLGAIVIGFTWPNYPYAYTPVVAISVFCTGLYTVSWQFDPCVKYQVYTDSRQLAKMPLINALSSASPIVLVRKDDTDRKIMHCSVTLLSVLFCAWKLVQLLK